MISELTRPMPSVSNPVVEVEDLTVRFPRRRKPALSQVSLRLGRGEHLLLLGPSGSGKSTLLQALTGVVPHSVTAEMSGAVSILGSRTSENSVVELSRHIGVLAQDPSTGICLPEVDQELALPLENQAVDPATIDARIDQVLFGLGLSELRARKTTELSGGEAQRLALAASVITCPSLLLLDEPTSMLDAAGVAAVRAALTCAWQQYRPAVVVVEHRLDHYAGPDGINALPARAIVLNEYGEIAADGPTHEVLLGHARTLHQAGCWLPHDAELAALTGVRGGLGAATNRAQLDGFAAVPSAADENRTTHRYAPGNRTAVLSARSLTVARPGMAPRPGRAHGHTRRTEDEKDVLLFGIDLDVHAGEIVAVLGENGVGKSTLLRTLAGLLPVAAGTVTGPRPGMVFQNPEHQFLSHTVVGDIGHGVNEQREHIVRRQLHNHRLEHLAEQNPFRLSGGEKRRLSLAAMLAHDRPILLLDEPTLGLDRRDTVRIAASLQEGAAAGCGIVFSTHELRLVATLADRAVVLARGGVIADGPILDVLRQADLLRDARLELPPLLEWLFERFSSAAEIRNVLHAMDQAVAVAP